MKKWISNNKILLKILLVIFILSILVGVYLYLKEPVLIKDAINNEMSSLVKLNTKPNNILYHLLILCLFIISSLSLIASPLIVLYFIYEGISIGFLISSLYKYNGLKGILFGSLFTLINKLLFILALIYLIIVTIKYVINTIIDIKNNKPIILEYLIYKGFIVIIITLITDTLLYFFSNKILSTFLFLV